MGKIFVATDTELKPLVSGNVNDGRWEDFTPYSSSGLSNISMKRREEGGLVHYTGTATTTSSGSILSASITLLNDNSMVIYKNVTSCTQANGTGWPLNIGDVNGTNVLSFTILDASRAGGMKATVAFDALANK